MECIAVRRNRDIVVHRATCPYGRKAWARSLSQNNVWLCDETQLSDPMAVACKSCKPDKP